MENRNQTVDALRAFAALAVCIGHFTYIDYFKNVSWVSPIGKYGWLGVDVFFVISGFIVPYSMICAKYTIISWPRFMLRRLLRLEPPYFASIALTVFLDFISRLSPAFRGQTQDFPTWPHIPDLAAHIGYLAGILGYPWVNPVYWTLAIELQFYIIIGIMLPLFLQLPRWVTLIILASISLSSVMYIVPAKLSIIIVPYFPEFLLGIVTCLYLSGRTSRITYYVMVVFFGLNILWIQDPIASLAAVVTALLIANVRLPRLRTVAWLGAISYSIYLVHVPIGGRVMNLAARLPQSELVEIGAIALAFALSMGPAYLLYLLVKRPAQRFARRIPYHAAEAPSVSADGRLTL